MKTWPTGTIYQLEPGEVCELPGVVIADIIWGLSDVEKRLVLGDMALEAPEAFQRAVMNRQQSRTNRYLRAKAESKLAAEHE